MARPTKDLETRVSENYPDFYKEVQTLPTDDLNSRLTGLAKGREETLEAKDNDEALEEAKESVSQLSGPYRDTLKAVSLKTRYLMKLLKDRGAA